MINPNQIRYAEDAFSKGVSEADIRNKLRGEGLTEDEISRVFSEARGKKDFLSGNVGSPAGTGQQASRPAQPIFTRPTPPPPASTPVFQRPNPPPIPPPIQTPPSPPVFSTPPAPPPPPPRPDARLQQDAQKIFQPLGGMGASRMLTAGSGGKTFWLFAMIFLILIVAGAGYYFKSDIMEIISPTKNVIEDNFGAYTPPVGNLNENQPPAEEEETPVLEEQQPPIDPDDAKITAIGQAKAFLASYFSQNNKYPTLEQFNAGFQAFQSDKDAFYCYRKEGTHYVVGTILADASKPVLQNDLDGVYACGSVNKDCVDPVYCVDNSH